MTKIKKTPKAQANEITELAKKSLKITTQNHLLVFSKKSFDPEKPARMRPGAEIVLDFLQATDPQGNQLVRVRKDGSTRTFYTNSQFVNEVLG
jgi:hypothetical protein